ncbi:hypothetical protein LINPERHAP1_LOCUS17568 [Linum perenne]
MWKPSGNMHIVDLDKSCFLVKFSVEQDYFKALTGGPWILMDHYLVIHQWDPSFRVSNELPKRMVAWVRFPHLPIHLYHGQVLTALGNLVGKTVKLDSTSQAPERGKFARIAVEIDLDRPLPSVVLLDRALQQVEYENLSCLCFECGLVGHERPNCPRRSGLIAPEKDGKASTSTAADGVTVSTLAADSYGPWMLVSRRSHRPAKESDADKESSPRQFGKGQKRKAQRLPLTRRIRRDRLELLGQERFLPRSRNQKRICLLRFQRLQNLIKLVIWPLRMLLVGLGTKTRRGPRRKTSPSRMQAHKCI